MCGRAKGQRALARRDSGLLASQLVRILAIVVAGLLVAAGDVKADQREDLQATGEQLAKDGRFGDAIEAFKAADRIATRASHACLIALAYTRLERWPQAEVFLAMCHERAKAGDPLPDWAPLADQQIKERLRGARVTEVSFEVSPPGAAARITVSSFAPDEVFEPRTIHLPPGTHVIFAKAEGYADKQVTVEIKDLTPQKVAIELAPAATAPPPTPEPEPTPQLETARPGPSRLGLYLMIGGGVAAIVGGSSHIKMADARRTLVQAGAENNPMLYDDNVSQFRRLRAFTITCYALSAGLVVTGYVLRKRSQRETASIAAVPLPEGGAFVSVGWSR